MILNTQESLGETYWKYKGRFVVTRYCSCNICCGVWADGKTFLGTEARYGVVAVDRRVIPLRSTLKVEGFPTLFSAEDVGGKIEGWHIDIFHYSHSYCRRWGRQKRKVWVKKKADVLSMFSDGFLDIAHHLVEILVCPFETVGV